MNVGERIKNRREELGMSVESLAKKIGKSRATIYRYESGFIEKLPTDVLIPFAEALHTTPEYLMGWTDDPQIQPKKEESDDMLNSLMEIYDGLSFELRQRLIARAMELDHMQKLMILEDRIKNTKEEFSEEFNIDVT